jgi:PAS domain S-box-containing protein
MRWRPVLYLVTVLALAAAYFGAAWLGLSLGFVKQVTVVWPPTGLALAAMLLLGYRVWPGIALGAFLVNLITPDECIATAAGIAVGNTLEAVLGTWLLRCVVGFSGALERLRDVLALVGLAAAVSTALCATIGVGTLCLWGVHGWDRFGSLWLGWWLGDATGALVVAPAILAWASRRPRWSGRRVAEASVLLVMLIAVSLLVFAGRPSAISIDHPLEYVVFPFGIWAALRLGQRGSTTVTLVASIIAVWGTENGHGPFNRLVVAESLVLLQCFMAAVAVTTLLLAASLAERDHAERRRAADQAVTHILAESATLAEATPRIVRTICESLQWDVGAVWTLDKDGKVLHCIELWHRPTLAISRFAAVSREQAFTPGIGMPGRVWSSGQPCWSADVVREANFPRAAIAAQEGLHAAFAFPILLRGEVLGVVEFFSREIRQPDRPLLQLFAAVGSQLGQFIDRTRSQKAVREGEQRLQMALDSARVVAWDWDLAGDQVHRSANAAELFGWPPDKVLSGAATFLDRIDPADRSHVEAAIRGAQEGGAGYDAEFRVRVGDASVRWVRDRARVVRDASGKPQRMIGVMWDITERKQAAEALQEADRRKDEFLAMLAHELRNPLAAVSNALNILRHPEASSADAERARAVMERQVHHLGRLVDDLLDVSRIMRGHIELRKESVDVATVIGRAVETVQPIIDSRGHNLNVTLPSEPVCLEGDLVRLAQVFGNLLANAAKFTEGRGTIHLNASVEDGEAKVSVRDNGVGIAPEVLPQVFDLFVQADQSIARSRGGLGIGLTIARRLVEMHGGRIAALSAGPGRGSEFVVHLPISARTASPKPREPVPTVHEPSPRRRILVVDDNIDAADSLAILLSCSGAEVRVAYDGPSALTAAHDFRPEVVFLDIGLPGMSGYEVARCLRTDSGFRPTLLIALTGYGQESDRRRAQDAGFDAHLVKPTDLDAVRALLARSGG